MKTLLLKAAAAAAVILPAAGAPAHAELVPEGPVPEGAVKLYLKDHQDLPMAAADGKPRLASSGDLWELSGEAMQDLGEFKIVHQASGQCLAADTSGGGEAVPVSLVDCADAHTWTIVYHNPGHKDFRFVAPGDYLLGLRERSDAVKGAEVLAIHSAPGDSMHFHEWLTESGTEATPPPGEITPAPGESTPPPGEDPSTSSSEAAAVPAASLPTTGATLGAGIGAGIVALAGGTALVLWWQRRRALRSDW